MFKIRVLNKIAASGLEQLTSKGYDVSDTFEDPAGVLLRSFKMHDMPIPASLQVVGRAGAGTNNIPVAKLSELGIPVLNTPGANANAVKELVIAGMLISARNICQAWQYVNDLTTTGDALNKEVEAGKKQFVGFELPGKTLGIIGLGAIGVKLANAALALGMNVVGYDPAISVKRAWELSSGVKHATCLMELLAQSDFVSCNVPLIDATRGLIGEKEFAGMKKGSVLLNFARQEVVDSAALKAALEGDHLAQYVSDFPSEMVRDHKKVISLPHLGASTAEAEENCAIMVARQVDDYLQNGNIVHSVNFPEVVMPRNGLFRLVIANKNIPNMLGQISTVLADANINILDMLNKSRDDVAYTLLDTQNAVDPAVITALENIEGVIRVRYIHTQ